MASLDLKTAFSVEFAICVMSSDVICKTAVPGDLQASTTKCNSGQNPCEGDVAPHVGQVLLMSSFTLLNAFTP